MATQVGWILDVVPSISCIPHAQDYLHIYLPSTDNDFSVQFAKINIFQDRSRFANDSKFLAEENCSAKDGWQEVVPLVEIKWIPSHLITGTSFVFMMDYFHFHLVDDCHGMSIFFVLNLACNETNVSVVPKDSCPPFLSTIESFSKFWSVCHSELIFNSI